MTSGIVLAIATLIFGVGMLGSFVRRNALTLALSIQLMFAASLVVLAGFDRRAPASAAAGELAGSVFAGVVLVAMAAELALAIAVAVSLVRHRDSLDVESANRMQE